MNQQPDSFFRNKFEGFQKPAPASAWEKIAAAQARKNNKGIWLKIAASLLLFSLVTYGLWSITTSQEKMADVQTLPPATQPDSAEALTPQIDDEPAIDLQQQAAARPEKSRAPKKVKTHAHELTIKTEISTDPANSIEIATQESREALPTLVDSTLIAHSYPVNESITLVFTATEANEYLNKKGLPEATDSTKKTSRLKRLLKKANDLTSNQDPFGELRQKKNEILALNFRSEKQRGQNK